MANPSVFDDYFRRADLDKDGKISGAEAVAFFQGANLPQVTLAKIWQFADQGSTGFLSKLEFYNALKLVTVAQSGRELTNEIVRAALAGPAAAQIPAPRIITPSSQPPGYPATQAPPQPSAGNFQAQGQFSSGSGAPPRSWSSQPSAVPNNNSGPPPAIPRPGSATGQRTSGGFVADTWPSIRSSSGNSAAQQAPVSAPTPAVSYQAGQTVGPSQGRKDASAGQPGMDNFLRGEGAPKSTPSTFTSASLVDAFGGDPFAAKAVVPVPPKPTPASSQGFGDFGDGGFRAEPSTMALVPTTAPSRDSSKDFQQHQAGTRSVMPAAAAGIGQGFGAPPPVGVGLGAPWPRMTPPDMQRYARVFAEVDTDKDGKITGEQARDLFLSWRLPREVLKQVWDLSDQDGDSMLSVREFCTSLYLMERFREGRPLPPVLPPGIFADDKPTEAYQPGGPIQQGRNSLPNNEPRYNTASWQQSAGGVQPTNAGFPRPMVPAGATTSQMPNSIGVGGDPPQAAQFKSKAPVLEPHLVNQLSRDEQDTLKSRQKDAEEAEKKAYELDKEIMDYKEKAEFYRTKLQEIILFKSRCENRLGEITERASADKREMESLAKKYDERFKAAGEVNSRLLAEEAAFRDIQERKIELYNAIAKMEQGGDANGLLQSKADRISSDLDELKKALNERAKRLGLNVKATAPTEQQFGWQPGLQEKAAEWDEDWDKFDDEGFASLQDFMDDATGGNLTASTTKPSASWDEGSPFGDDGFASSPKVGPTVEVSKEHNAADLASPRADSESGRSGLESPTNDVSTSNHDKQANSNKANQRYANLTESQEDVFNGPTSYSSTTNSDTFGDGGVSWSAAFSHDEEVDSGVRASWGLQSNPPSTQASLDVTGSRTSRFGKAGLSSHGFGDSLDIGSMHVSSPGRVLDVSSPTLSHGGNGFRDSEGYDGFGPLGSSKDFDRSPRFFGGNHNTHTESALFDSPRKSGAGSDHSFTRFDSFASPQNNPAFPGIGDNSFGGGNQSDRSFARFDSFSSVKGDGANGRVGAFRSFDEGEDLFAGTGPFSASGQEKKTGGQEKKASERGWSAF
ncbi:unnamed protein product [Calypogeia fissa]